MNKPILFGTDPEFALKNSENRIVSAIPILERDKSNKIDLGERNAIYFDNVLAEANIPPADSKEDLKAKLRTLYQKSKEILKGHKLLAIASHSFTDDECEHPEAKKFGCDPELDIDLGGPAYPPSPEGAFRSAGGHIHIGNFEKESIYDKLNLVYLMDLFVGVPGVLLDNDPTSLARKQLYGKAGRFRDTDYGLEYRTLSNFWLSCPELTEIIYDLTILATEIERSGEGERILANFNREDIANAINYCDKDLAKKIVDNLPMSAEIKQRIFDLSKREYSEDIFENWTI